MVVLCGDLVGERVYPAYLVTMSDRIFFNSVYTSEKRRFLTIVLVSKYCMSIIGNMWNYSSSSLKRVLMI
jgi:hypothetical protein